MNTLNGKTILVTGGNGFIGSNFIEYVLKEFDVNVVNLDKLGIGSRNLDYIFIKHPTQYTEITADVSKRDEKLVGFLKTRTFSHVFHFAAESHVDRSIQSPVSFVKNNIMATMGVLEYVRMFSPETHIINIGTDEVYGQLGVLGDPFTETSPLDPRSPYSASKASSDLLAFSYASTYNLKVTTTRCCNNFGPGQHKEKFIPTIIRNLVNDTEIPVYGNGLNVREWIYVEDHVKSLLEIMDHPCGYYYNIGSGLEISNIMMIQRVAKILNKKPIMKFVEDRKGHDFRYALESLNYKRSFELKLFDDAFEKTVNSYLVNGFSE